MSWGNPQTKLDILQKNLLSPMALFYGIGQAFHKSAFENGFLLTHNVSVPVISLGNITCGGTGKTPLVIDIASRFIDNGHKIGIISRGYKRKSGNGLTIVSDGQGNLSSCLESGDEPFMIAHAVRKAIVISSADRVAAAQQAVDIYKCDLLLLDDGFQHYRLKRDLDVVLVDYSDDMLNDSLLPAGRLREPIINLKRASNVIITKVPRKFDRKRMNRLEKLILSLAPHATVNACRFVPISICRQENGESIHTPMSTLSGKTVFAFCGLARPQNFISLLEDLGAKVVGKKLFPDHYWYTNRDIELLERELKRTKASVLITTQKDFVKVNPAKLSNQISFVALETEWLNQFPQALQTFVDFGHVKEQTKYRTNYPYQSSEPQFLKR